MRKVVLVSDTHGHIENLEKVIDDNRDMDLLIHLGDVGNDYHCIERRLHCAVKIMRGNNDWTNDLPDKVIMNIMGHKIFVTHGHLYNVMYGLDRLLWVAREQECDIALFGHTHMPVVEKGEDVTLVNPGSLTFPRQTGHRPSYIIMKMYEDGLVEYEIKYL